MRPMLCVNVGSGLQMREGFENLDNSPFLWLAPFAPVTRWLLPLRYHEPIGRYAQARRKGAVKRHDCTKPLPYDAHTVDHILCSHMLEHVPADTMVQMLADFHRVLRPAGSLHVIVPHFRRFTERYVRGELNADEYQDWLLFQRRTGTTRRARVAELFGSFGFLHVWQYDADTGTQRLEQAGFTVKYEMDTPSTGYRADDDSSLHLYAIA
jgi:predicted SAM-dependent methyltransferase